MSEIVRAMFFVDGFNLYHAIDKRPSYVPFKERFQYHKYKWLDLNKLCRAFTTKNEVVDKIFYFTTYATWAPEKEKRHRIYVRALESVKVIPVFGKFKNKTIRCLADCNKKFSKPEEKQTDVNIAITILREAFADTFDKAFIISGDSDLIPCIKAVKDLFPNKKIGIIMPPDRHTQELKDNSDFYMRIKEIQLKTSQFPDPITDEQGNPILQKPAEWA